MRLTRLLALAVLSLPACGRLAVAQDIPSAPLAADMALSPRPLPAAQPSPLEMLNRQRAARGLPPFKEDPGLTAAAQRAASERAAMCRFEHLPDDFACLPPGCHADAAGCGCWHPQLGFMACAAYEGYEYAGAAMVPGRDGRVYCHLFVRGGQSQPSRERMSYSSGPRGSSYSHSVQTGRRGFFRRR